MKHRNTYLMKIYISFIYVLKWYYAFKKHVQQMTKTKLTGDQEEKKFLFNVYGQVLDK